MTPMELAWDSLKKNWYEALARYQRGGRSLTDDAPTQAKLRGQSMPQISRDINAPYAAAQTTEATTGSSSQAQAFGQHEAARGSIRGDMSQGGVISPPGGLTHAPAATDPRIYSPAVQPQATSVTAPSGSGLPYSHVQGW
jgi:hypothetical protein